jgi:diacylglycerol kinase family enzyme
MPRDLQMEKLGQVPGAVGKVCILVNCGSGKQTADDSCAAIEAAFAKLDFPVTLRRIEQGPDIARMTRQAMDDGFGTIVAAGGDGTICGVAAAIAGQEGIRMGVIPLGTFNYFCRSVGVPADMDKAAAIVAAGHARGMDAGYVNDRLFLNNASLGAYPAILETRETVYKTVGRSRMAAYWSVVHALIGRRGFFKGKVEAQGQSRAIRASLLFCVTNAYQLDSLALGGAEAVRSGKMALFIAPQASALQMVATAVGLLAGKLQKHRDYEIMTGTEFTVAPRRARQKVARDGEWTVETGPFTFRLVKNALTMVLPKHPETVE